jgi:Zn-dependent metalloprotease
VHINSGIPNRAFYEAAIRLGGYAWEKAGLIWYKTLCDRLKPLATFGDAVRLTGAVAKELFGATEAKAVKEGWKAVGL